MVTEQHPQWPKYGAINIFRLKDYSLSQESEIGLDNRSRTKAGTTSSHIADMSGTIDLRWTSAFLPSRAASLFLSF